MAEEAGYSDEFKGIRIATVARLGEEKGVWIALEACSELVRQGYDICWYLIGNGPLREKLETKIRELGLDKHFILLGEKLNPYPFMKGCDIYVQPSKTEAHCVAVEEAKLLYRPIVVTDIPSFRKQINDGETGIIVPMNGEGLAYGIRRLVTSIDLRKRLTNNLLSSENRNEIEMKKFLTMIEG
jgi:glycosyltransferase involved in cell wall biosynthesis